MTKGLINPSRFDTYNRTCLVAVAVNAIIHVFCGIKLLNSPTKPIFFLKFCLNRRLAFNLLAKHPLHAHQESIMIGRVEEVERKRGGVANTTPPFFRSTSSTPPIIMDSWRACIHG